MQLGKLWGCGRVSVGRCVLGPCTQPLNHVHCVLRPGVERWYLQVLSPRVRARAHTQAGARKHALAHPDTFP